MGNKKRGGVDEMGVMGEEEREGKVKGRAWWDKEIKER